MGVTLKEHAARTRLAWEAGDREAGLEWAMMLAYELSDRVRQVADHSGAYGEPSAERTLERITPQLCALAERLDAS